MRHRWWYDLSERTRWSRGEYHEAPARTLPHEAPEQASRIAALRDGYHIVFENRLSAPTSRNNYEYLDLLDRTWRAAGLPRPAGGTVCDVGCASFWYAAALHAFFQPRELIGVEVEGHRLFKDGRARIDYAAGYVAALPGARFVVADYVGCAIAADVITCCFPFVTPAAILAWRLPLSLLRPERLFAQIRANLRPGGMFVMLNHGPDEAALAAAFCGAAGLHRLAGLAQPGVLSAYRLQTPIASCWC